MAVADAAAPLLRDVALSVVCTTVVGLALAAFGAFSPWLLLLAMAACGGAAVVWGRRSRTSATATLDASSRSPGVPLQPGRWIQWLGPLALLSAIALYWPPYETHMAGTDSTAYLASGAYLARSGSLSRRDPLLAELPRELRRALFLPALGGADKPPYVRMPGGMSLASIDDTIVQPNFFPTPMLWAALFTTVAGARYAGGYAALFAGLSLWALWEFARRRMSPAAAATVTALAGLNLAGYWAGRFALSEPIACFLLWSGLVALDQWESCEGGSGADAGARAAGILLGAVGLARLDYTLFLILALLLRWLLAEPLGWRRLPLVFYAGFLAATTLTLLEAVLIEGGYALPLTDAWDGLVARAAVAWASAPARTLGIGGAAVVGAGVAAARFGLARVAAASAVCAFVVVYTVFASQPQLLRSFGWISQCLGMPALVLAAGGAVVLWRNAKRRSNDGFVVVLVVLIGFLLLYNPHVQPFLLWALRRFVPLVIPAVLVLAAVAAEALRLRRRAVGVAVWIVLVGTALWPARWLWGEPLYRGAYQQIMDLDQQIPRGSVVLVDARLASYMLCTPLWLLQDRDCISVQTGSSKGREVAAELATGLASAHAVYFVTPADAPVVSWPGLAAFGADEPAARYRFELLFPDQPPGSGTVGSRLYRMPVSVFEVAAPRD